MTSPEGSNELLPTRLYPAEFVMLPFFWLAPLNLLVLGGAIYLDGKRLDDLGVEFTRARWTQYLLVFVFAHLGTVAYRTERRRAVVESQLGISLTEFARHTKNAEPPTSRLVAAVFLGQLVVLALVFAGSATLAGVGLLANLVVAPLAVWRDLRHVRRFDCVAWGWPRFLHPLAAAVPPLAFVYLLQRQEHLHYAMVVRLWDGHPDELAIDRMELSTAERVGQWLEDLT